MDLEWAVLAMRWVEVVFGRGGWCVGRGFEGVLMDSEMIWISDEDEDCAS